MKIEITGNRCISCVKFVQYYAYAYNWRREPEPIDCGYCGQKSRNVRPGDRCSYYHEASNIGSAHPLPEKYLSKK